MSSLSSAQLATAHSKDGMFANVLANVLAKCKADRFSDLLQRHHILVHKEGEEQCSDQEGSKIQRRPIACVACARAKTKCDKSVRLIRLVLFLDRN